MREILLFLSLFNGIAFLFWVFYQIIAQSGVFSLPIISLGIGVSLWWAIWLLIVPSVVFAHLLGLAFQKISLEKK